MAATIALASMGLNGCAAGAGSDLTYMNIWPANYTPSSAEDSIRRREKSIRGATYRGLRLARFSRYE